MQHDMTVHPDGRIYSVDMTQDQLYRLDPRVPDGDRASFWRSRHGDLPLGGVFATPARPTCPPRTRTSVRTRSRSRRTARSGSRSRSATSSRASIRRRETLDPPRARARLLPAHAALRCARAHLVLDRRLEPPRLLRSGERREPRRSGCPRARSARRWSMRSMPFLMWLGRHVDLRGAAAEGDGFKPPHALRRRRRAGRLGLVQPAERAPHRPRRSGQLRDRDDRDALHRSAPHALRRRGPALDPRLLVRR